MKFRAPLIGTAILCGVFWIPRLAPAASGTWTNTEAGAVGYWTNSGNWSASPYPAGGATVDDGATIGNDSPNTYTCILDAALSNTVETTIKNYGGGQAWLIVSGGGRVTNQYWGNVYNGGNLVIKGTGSYFGVSSYGVNITGQGRTVIVTNGGYLFNSGSFGFQLGGNGYGSSGNTNNILFVTGVGSTGNVGSLYVGNGAFSTSNRSVVQNGGTLKSSSVTIGNGGTNLYNSITITDPGSTYIMGAITIGSGYGAVSNFMTVSNGATAYQSGAGNIIVGNGAGADYNTFNVGGEGGSCVVTANYNHYVGNGSSFNTLTVTNGSMICGPTSYATTSGNNGSSNIITVTAGGYLQVGAMVSGSGTAYANEVRVVNGGILEANSMTTGAGAGNMITNTGGIFQFTKSFYDGTWPPNKITNAVPGNIILNNGTISYRGVTYSSFSIYENRDTALTNITFLGDNAFRLDNSILKQPTSGRYTFDTGLGATNYCALEMVNGTTALPTGLGVTIGSNGWLLVRDTTAMIGGSLTNSGALRVLSGVLNCTNLVLGPSTTTLIGLSATTNGYVNVSGAFTCGGTLVITNMTGFPWAFGQSWNLFDWTGDPIVFASLILPPLGGLQWDTKRLRTEGIITVGTGATLLFIR